MFVTTREIFAIPYDEQDIIDLPRGKKRAFLAENGLIGTIEISSDYGVHDIVSKISSLFAACVGLDDGDQIAFHFLRPMPGNAKKLQRARVSHGFNWDGKAVAGLGKKYIYIMLEDEYNTLTVSAHRPASFSANTFRTNAGHPTQQTSHPLQRDACVAGPSSAPASIILTSRTDQLFQPVLDALQEELLEPVVEIQEVLTDPEVIVPLRVALQQHWETVKSNTVQPLLVRRGPNFIKDVQR